MDEETNGLGWVLDGTAATVLAGAAGWSGLMFTTPMIAAGAAALAFVAGMAALRLVGGGGYYYPLPALEPLAWDDILAASEPLLPDAPLSSDGRVVRLVPRHARTDSHEANSTTPVEDVVLLGADASAALRRAFSELKQSLR